MMQHNYIVLIYVSVKISIPVLFEGDLAHTANCHLKKNDRVHITGQVFVDASPSGANPDQEYLQVCF